ncbi:hypothetical protein BCR44DRAFT_305064 [Catenaria anguillulae PL171]|uniref:Uncharacterized protein n=1 Tax=Catenaria anguillulae PL171 TaxID=765915 RepID=A0A1Y2I5H5_9FUNG|nr:hypothetical protein BCR44DRAFT_305064 [Catenaria anguillulae PL171]
MKVYEMYLHGMMLHNQSKHANGKLKSIQCWQRSAGWGTREPKSQRGNGGRGRHLLVTSSSSATKLLVGTGAAVSSSSRNLPHRQPSCWLGLGQATRPPRSLLLAQRASWAQPGHARQSSRPWARARAPRLRSPPPHRQPNCWWEPDGRLFVLAILLIVDKVVGRDRSNGLFVLAIFFLINQVVGRDGLDKVAIVVAIDVLDLNLLVDEVVGRHGLGAAIPRVGLGLLGGGHWGGLGTAVAGLSGLLGLERRGRVAAAVTGVDGLLRLDSGLGVIVAGSRGGGGGGNRGR